MATKIPKPVENDAELSYTRLSPPVDHTSGNSTRAPIVFLHGLSTCRLEYSLVTPFLSKDYDLILIDLPGHSESNNISFTLDNAINKLHDLITTKIAGGKVHIVALSLGGFTALEFTRRHPEVVLSLFCTGCAPMTGIQQWIMSHPLLMSSIDIVAGSISNDRIFWGFIGVDPFPALRVEMRRNHSLELLRSGYGTCSKVTMERISEIRGVRIAIVAGAKRDDVEQTREAGRVLATSNPECKAFVVKKAVHLWDLQLPELFASGVRAWVEGAEMPKDFELLR